MTTTPSSALVARKTWTTLEPIHGLVYFAPDADEIYGDIGLVGRSGYFASRSAALGAALAEVVQATFFNFHPTLVREALAGVWDRVTPAQVLAAREAVIDAALRTALGDAVGGADMAEAADLARSAAESIVGDVVGRPLFAAHAALDWPDEPHLVLWYAQTLLREYRGDVHIAALVTEGLDGLGALVSHAASGSVPAEVLRRSRAWSTDEWDAAVAALRDRGLLTGDDTPTFTPEGEAQRQRIEATTDARSAAAYETLGEDGCARLRELARPFAAACVATFVLPAAFG